MLHQAEFEQKSLRCVVLDVYKDIHRGRNRLYAKNLDTQGSLRQKNDVFVQITHSCQQLQGL